MLALAGIGMALPVWASAQTVPSASRVSPETLAPVRPDMDNPIIQPEVLTPDVAGTTQALNVTVSDIVVAGIAQAPKSVVRTIIAVRAQLVGRRVGVAELYSAAARIESAYAKAGYVLTRVTLPPQHLSDGGTVRFLIVNGFIESVDVSALPVAVRKVIGQRVAALVGAHELTLSQIERRVLLAGDIPGVRLRSTLMRGDAPGAARLVLSGDYRAVSGVLSFDNDLGSAYQYEAFSIQLAANSVLRLGEQLYIQATSGPDFRHLFSANTRRRILGGGAIFAIGNKGMTLNPEYTRVDTNPRSGSGTLPETELFERFAVRVNYPLIRSHRENLTLNYSLEMSRETATAGVFDISQDRLRVATLGANLAQSMGGTAAVSADAFFSFGLAGLGARTQADAVTSGVPLSRQGSRPDLRKINVHFRVDDQLGSDVDLSLALRAQASFTGALPASAMFSLDGGDGLSAFPQGSVSADSGVIGRLELSRPCAIVGKGDAALTPYAFGALGYGHLSDPTALEVADIHSWSAGVGLRILLGAPSGSSTSFGMLEVSHGHVSTLPRDPTRVSASFSFRFQ